MHVWTSALVSLFLLSSAAGLILLHLRSWRSAQGQELDPEERTFRHRQFRRRIQTSGMLGLLAVALFFGQFLTEPPLLMFIFWGVVLLLIVWVALLAAADMLAIRHHFNKLRRVHLTEQAKLHAELHRMERARRNGKSKHE